MDKSALMTAFTQYLLPVLATAIASGLAWVLGQLGLWIKVKWGETKTAAALLQLTVLAELAVTEVEQTIRPTLKAVTADGHITKEEAAMLKTKATDKLLELVKLRGFEEAQKLLKTVSPAVATLVSGLIERAVSRLGPSEPAAPAAVVVTANPS